MNDTSVSTPQAAKKPGFLQNVYKNMSATDANGTPQWANVLNKTGAALQGKEATALPSKKAAQKNASIPTEAAAPQGAPPMPPAGGVPATPPVGVPPINPAVAPVAPAVATPQVAPAAIPVRPVPTRNAPQGAV